MIAKVVTGICCALIATLVLLGVALTAGRLNGAPTPALSSQVPNDVDMNSECKRKNECAFDEFSWESFVALNWAAVPGKRGRQDSAKPIWDKNRDKMAGDRMWVPAPRVWETWKADYELFQNRTAPAPSPWDSFDGQTPCKGPFDHRAKVLASFSMTGNFNQAGDGKPDGPLIAQNGTYVRFEVRINEPEFDYILEKGYYLANLLRKPKNNLWADFPTGSIGIK